MVKAHVSFPIYLEITNLTRLNLVNNKLTLVNINVCTHLDSQFISFVFFAKANLIMPHKSNQRYRFFDAMLLSARYGDSNTNKFF